MKSDMSFQLKSPPCIAEIVDGEYVVINLDTGKYYNMVGLGAEVFELLIGGAPKSALLSLVCSDGDFAPKLDDFIAVAVEEGLIQQIDVSASGLPLKSINLTGDLESLTIKVYTDMQELLGLDPIHEVDPAQGWPNQA